MPLPEFGNAIILGEARVGDVNLSFVVECSCGTTFIWSGRIQDVRYCQGPGCKLAYHLPSWPVVSPNNPRGINVVLGVGMRP